LSEKNAIASTSAASGPAIEKPGRERSVIREAAVT
jgi:hypothetical protein